MFGEPTNKKIMMLTLIAVALSAFTVALMLWGRKTILMEPDSSGSILYGEMKQHLPKANPSQDPEEE